ncbi:MAG: DUF6268 family outer membrane beta-barrel protein, partial [Prevotella sp.]|nr:DUF6268 family outer membrane beta-barrel protein [Prevotella sp.]
MKLISLFLAVSGILLCVEGKAQQVSFKTEYVGNSGYYFLPPSEKPREKIGDSNGSAVVCQGAVNIPLSMKLNENNRPIAWGIGLGGSYTSMNKYLFKIKQHYANSLYSTQFLLPPISYWSCRREYRRSCNLVVLSTFLSLFSREFPL